MSYDPSQKPVGNYERFPPIAMQAHENQDHTEPGAAQMMPPAMLETGTIIMHNTPGVLLENDDRSALEPKNIVFNDQTIRKGFIRKVYLIVVAQLIVTSGIIALFVFHKPTKMFVRKNSVVLPVACIINIIVMLSMACCEGARRIFPLNFACLGLFTFTMSLLLGAAASTLDASEVLMAVGITALLVLALSIFAIQTKYDFTAWGGVLISCVMVLFIMALTGIFLRDRIFNMIYSCIGALLASFLLIYDTQLIIGGNHKYQFSPEEYIFAALTLYVDIVRIFIYVLRMIRR